MLENIKIQFSQCEYLGFLISFRIIVVPFHKIAIEKIIRDIIKITLVFFRIPKYETGWSLGSNSGKRYKHIKGETKPNRIENER